MRAKPKRIAKWAGLGLLLILVVIQFVPFGRAHTNPRVLAEPAWDTPRTRELAVQACFDCHSNETEWPWYSHVAPISWLVQDDVDKARKELNFSEWTRPQNEAGEAAEAVEEGKMPLRIYTWIHPRARLSSKEKDALVRGLRQTLGAEGDDD